jgi:hypothetical protein
MSGAAIWLRVTAQAGSWLGSAALTLLRWARSIGSGVGLPSVRQQLLDPAVQLRGQPREDVLQVGPRLMPVE